MHLPIVLQFTIEAYSVETMQLELKVKASRIKKMYLYSITNLRKLAP